MQVLHSGEAQLQQRQADRRTRTAAVRGVQDGDEFWEGQLSRVRCDAKAQQHVSVDGRSRWDGHWAHPHRQCQHRSDQVRLT